MEEWNVGHKESQISNFVRDVESKSGRNFKRVG